MKRATAEIYSLSPAVAGSDPFFITLTWGLRPRLCLRLLSQAKKHHSISTFCAKPLPNYFFRVAAAFFAERDRDLADRLAAALRA